MSLIPLSRSAGTSSEQRTTSFGVNVLSRTAPESAPISTSSPLPRPIGSGSIPSLFAAGVTTSKKTDQIFAGPLAVHSTDASMSHTGKYSPTFQPLGMSLSQTEKGGFVHIIWDAASLVIPPGMSPVYAVQCIVQLAEQYGLVSSFHYICTVGSLELTTRLALQECGVIVEEVISQKPNATDVYVVTRMLRLSLAEQLQSGYATGPRPVLILLTTTSDFAQSLTSIRQSGLFVHCILVHGKENNPGLIHASTQAFEWSQLLFPHGTPYELQQFFSSAKASSTESRMIGKNELNFQGTLDYWCKEEGSSNNNTALSPLEEPYGATQKFDFLEEGFYQSKMEAEGQALMKKPTERAGTSLQKERETMQKIQEYSQLRPGANILSGGISTLPTGRSLLPTGVMNLSSVDSSGARSERNSRRINVCILAFTSIMSYCEREKIIPRESVFKKRLLDSKLAADIEFEELIHILLENNVAYVEGEIPQRIIWPRSPDKDGPRRFPCADFFQPTQRLSAEQSQELLTFLQKNKPEVDRGRFGFAQYLSRQGPRFAHHLPHGVLVELVQLLLNQKVLLFRKGKVSVSPSFPQNIDLSLPFHYSPYSVPSTPTVDEETGSTTTVTAPSNNLSGGRPRLGSAPSSMSSMASSSALYVDFGERKREITNNTWEHNLLMSTSARRRSLPLSKDSETPATVSFLQTPSARKFIPAAVLSPSAEFNAVQLLNLKAAAGMNAHRDRLEREKIFAAGKASQSEVDEKGLPLRRLPCHLPLYHYEQTVASTSNPVWVAVCTLSLRLSPINNVVQVHSFKSTQRRVDEEARQESAVRALQDCLWTLVFDSVLAELQSIVPKKLKWLSKLDLEQLQQHEDTIFADYKLLCSKQQDSVAELDRLLAYFQQQPIVYNMESVVVQNAKGARTIWRCTAKVHFISGAGIEGSGTLHSHTRTLISVDGKAFPMRSVPISCSSSQARKSEAKMQVATQILKRLEQPSLLAGHSKQSQTRTSHTDVLQPMPPFPQKQDTQAAAILPCITSSTISSISSSQTRKMSNPANSPYQCGSGAVIPSSISDSQFGLSIVAPTLSVSAKPFVSSSSALSFDTMPSARSSLSCQVSSVKLKPPMMRNNATQFSQLTASDSDVSLLKAPTPLSEHFSIKSSADNGFLQQKASPHSKVEEHLNIYASSGNSTECGPRSIKRSNSFLGAIALPPSALAHLAEVQTTSPSRDNTSTVLMASTSSLSSMSPPLHTSSAEESEEESIISSTASEDVEIMENVS